MPEYRDIVGPASSNKGTDVKLYDTLSDRPTAATFGVGQCQVGGTVYVSDGVKWVGPLNDASVTYNGDGTIATAIINGVTYTFTYVAGVLSTISDGVETQTFTWANGAISSVTVA